MATPRGPFAIVLLAGIAAMLAGCQSLPPAAVRGAAAPAAATAAAAMPAPLPAPQPAAGAPSAEAAAAPPPPPSRPLRIGLALGGGAARGFAHVGVIKALEARGIHPDIVAGTSAGSFVAALYAAGYHGLDLQRVALQFEQSSITDWSLPSRGLFKGQALQDFVNREVQQRSIEMLPRKLGVVATDLGSGEMMVFERGNVGMAVRASSSVPGVFQPVAIGGHEYVDGGLVSPVPARAARRMGADVVIAVDISKMPASQSTTGAFDILLQTFTIMGRVIAQSELQSADVILRPALGSAGSTDFSSRESLILDGEEAVAAQAGAITEALERARQAIGDAGRPPAAP
jgi:NTE family protein